MLAEVIDLDSASIKDILFQLKGEMEPFFGVIGGKDGDKCSLSIIASDSLVKDKGIHAGNLVREAAKLIQGGGGCQPFFATAGGKDASGLKAAVAEVRKQTGI